MSGPDTDAVERVARAIWNAGNSGRNIDPWDCLVRDDPDIAEECRDEARAAIAAMSGWRPIAAAPVAEPPVVEAGRETTEAEIAQLRSALIAIGRMIPGCVLADDVSSGLLTFLPVEVGAWKDSVMMQQPDAAATRAAALEGDGDARELIGYYASHRPEQADREIANDVIEAACADNRMLTFRDMVLVATRSRLAAIRALAPPALPA